PNPPASPHLSPLSLHDALPISGPPVAQPHLPVHGKARLLQLLDDRRHRSAVEDRGRDLDSKCVSNPTEVGLEDLAQVHSARHAEDRKSTRLNSSHQIISYAVFC